MCVQKKTPKTDLVNNNKKDILYILHSLSKKSIFLVHTVYNFMRIYKSICIYKKHGLPNNISDVIHLRLLLFIFTCSTVQSPFNHILPVLLYIVYIQVFILSLHHCTFFTYCKSTPLLHCTIVHTHTYTVYLYIPYIYSPLYIPIVIDCPACTYHTTYLHFCACHIYSLTAYALLIRSPICISLPRIWIHVQ